MIALCDLSLCRQASRRDELQSEDCSFFTSHGITLISDSLLMSHVNKATCCVETRINKVIRSAREVARVPIRHRRVPYPIFIAFYDAAWAVRKDGKSQDGLSARWKQSAHITSVVLVTQVCLAWPEGARDAKCSGAIVCHEELTTVRSAHTEMWEGTEDLEHVLPLVTVCKGTARLNDNDNDTLIEGGSNMC